MDIPTLIFCVSYNTKLCIFTLIMPWKEIRFHFMTNLSKMPSSFEDGSLHKIILSVFQSYQKSYSLCYFLPLRAILTRRTVSKFVGTGSTKSFSGEVNSPPLNIKAAQPWGGLSHPRLLDFPSTNK